MGATLTYTNSTGLNFTDNGLASQTLDVFGLGGQTISDVRLTLGGVNQTNLSDLDILLIGPGAASNLMVLSDANGIDDMNGGGLTFSDSASAGLELAGTGDTIDGGTFRPTDFGGTETTTAFGLPAGVLNHSAPAGGATFGSAFDGLAPNGTWTLAVNDDVFDAFPSAGGISSWSLSVTTSSNSVFFQLPVSGGNVVVFQQTSPAFHTGEFTINGGETIRYSLVFDFIIVGTSGADIVYAASANDVLAGGGGRDTLYGNGGADQFNIGASDVVAGEIIDGGSGTDELAFQNTGTTIDIRSGSFRSIERLDCFTSLTTATLFDIRMNASQFGSTGISLTAIVDGFSGKDHNFEITMGSVSALNLSGLTVFNFTDANDKFVIFGDGSSETITGTTAHDEIFGNGGADVLNGFTGADLMRGGLGDDTYHVDNAGDVTDEFAGGGGTLDQVFSSVSFTAALGIEKLTLTGTANINVIGQHAQNDTLIGNSGNNILNGLTGADTMRGGQGNDTYFVDNSGDFTDEVTGGFGGGIDTVKSFVTYVAQSGIEFVILQGTDAINGIGRNGQNDDITGNSAINTLNGLSGDDTLDGGLGGDSLIGGAGLDVFQFTSSLAAPNMDFIIDYSIADDSIQLDNAVFALLGGVGALGVNLFKNLALGAQDADDVILYNQANGALFVDTNGLTAGGLMQFADVTNGLVLTASEFTVI